MAVAKVQVTIIASYELLELRAGVSALPGPTEQGYSSSRASFAAPLLLVSLTLALSAAVSIRASFTVARRELNARAVGSTQDGQEKEQDTFTTPDGIIYDLEDGYIYDIETNTRMGSIDGSKTNGIDWIKSSLPVHAGNVIKHMAAAQ